MTALRLIFLHSSEERSYHQPRRSVYFVGYCTIGREGISIITHWYSSPSRIFLRVLTSFTGLYPVRLFKCLLKTCLVTSSLYSGCFSLSFIALCKRQAILIGRPMYSCFISITIPIRFPPSIPKVSPIISGGISRRGMIFEVNFCLKNEDNSIKKCIKSFP